MANSWVVAASLSVELLGLTAPGRGGKEICLPFANYNLARTPAVDIIEKT